MKNAVSICILLVLMVAPTSAHSGRTDSNGGHWNRKEGTYHYHNGGKASSGPSATTEIPSQNTSTKVSIGDVGNYVYVIQNANLRKGPGSEYDVVRLASKDSLVKVLSVDGSWAKVQMLETSDGEFWISLSLLKK